MAESIADGLNLVTGGTGLLGSHIAQQIVKAGGRVRALVRSGSDTRFLESLGAELVEGDITDAAALMRACEGVTRVYHAAARVGDWGPWREFVEITIEATRKLLEAATACGVRRFLHISSISAYGHVNEPGLVLDETAPLGRCLNKWSYYSRAKVAAEEHVWSAHNRGDLEVTVVRPSWLYGPRDRATIGRLCESIRKGKIRLMGDGNNRLNLVHAGNVAEAVVKASVMPEAVGEAFNCSNDGAITQRQYFNMVAEALGEGPVTRKIPYRLAYNVGLLLEVIGHTFRLKRNPLITRYSVWLMGRKTFFECQKARRMLDWQPTVTYEQGIPEAVAYYLEHQDRRSSAPSRLATAAG